MNGMRLTPAMPSCATKGPYDPALFLEAVGWALALFQRTLHTPAP